MQSTIQKTQITFPVSDVEPRVECKLPLLDYKAAIELKLGSPVEACSVAGKTLFKDEDVHHPFLMALSVGYNCHYPVTISPDMIWLLISQGFAQHVNLNSEALRDRLVNHDKKQLISIRRDDFVKGKPTNPWPETFSAFSRAAQAHIKADLYSILVPSFSTTTEIEKAAFEVAFMDALSSYLEYRFGTVCGFPSITLEGTPEDWQLVNENACKLAAYDLDWWIEPILPLLEKIKETSKGNIDNEFWKSFF
ncbi:MAG TPA: DUF4419 domain-containing protein [Flavisolibacter sp.]|nr:DUF4419 domain-containing protein [Flavisolibacter sp.]